MVETSAGQEIDPTASDTVGGDLVGVKEGVVGEEERVAPWQQDVQQSETEKDGVKQEGESERDGGEVKSEAVEVNGADQEASEEVDFSALGSADEIAAAVLQSANISSLFESDDTTTTTTTRGIKRSHDDMAIEEEGATNTTIAPIQSTAEADGEPIAVTAPASSLPSVSTSAPSSSQVPPSSMAAAPSTITPMQNSIASSPALPVSAPLPAQVITNSNSLIENSTVNAPVVDTEEADDSFLGSLDLEAVAQAAMGLDADGNPLPGNEESHRALAEAVKQLSAAQGVTLSSARSGDESSDNGGNGPAKRFQCTQCERAFARAYNLNTHLATHDPDPSRSKPFPCPYPSCKTDGGRSFSRKHDLQRHVASTHENEPEPVTSTMGENGLRQTGALASLGLGTPGRKFRCDDCGRAFVRRDALKRHQCTKVMETPTTHTVKQTPDYYSNMAAGLSLYTSNPASTSLQSQQPPPQPAAKTTESAESSYDSDPFGPNGITYENLSKEVQDMAMQLVAQAQSYNEQQSGPPTAKTVAAPQVVPKANITSAAAPPRPPPISQPTTVLSAQPLPSSSVLPGTVKSEIKTESSIPPATPATPSASIKVESPPSTSTAAPLSATTPSTSHAPSADPISAQ